MKTPKPPAKGVCNRMRRYIYTGIIFIFLGVMGIVFIEPPLVTPLHPTNSFWFRHNLRHTISLILQLLGLFGVVLLVIGIIKKIIKKKRLAEKKGL